MRDFSGDPSRVIWNPDVLAPKRAESDYPVRPGLYDKGIKRAIDIGLILVCLPIVLPIILLCAGLIALDGGHPFYSQTRVGRGGKSFRMWKLRTMVIGADKALDRYLSSDPKARAEWNLKQKLEQDPRITRIGRALRKTSLDELPQLFNVLIGDMSLVGPRPMLPEQKRLYPGDHYYALRPGITGPWQTSERNKSSFELRALYDEDYWTRLSFRTDVTLLFKTIGVLARPNGM